MAAPRSTSLRALRLLAAQQHAPLPSSALASVAPFRRSLHITGAFSAQPARGPDVTAIYRSRGLGDLRAECERRNLRSAGNKAEVFSPVFLFFFFFLQLLYLIYLLHGSVARNVADKILSSSISVVYSSWIAWQTMTFSNLAHLALR